MSNHLRVLAAQVLVEILSKQRSLTHVLPLYKPKCRNPQDAAFLQALCYGVLRFFPRLVFIATQLLTTPLKQKDNDILYLMCIGLYQLIELKVPPHAAISETVEAAKILKKPWASGLINAVLRNYLRQSELLLKAVSNHSEAATAHPLWLLEHIKAAWPLEADSIIHENNQLPPLVLRVNQQKISREHYLLQLEKLEMTAKIVPGTTCAILLPTPQEVTHLPGFKEGWFSVQDGAAQLTPSLLNLSPGLRVLDACAAPGGKTTHIIETEPQLAEVVALDISLERTKSIQENLNRLQLSAAVLTHDAMLPATWWDGQLFDRILLDAPCSSSGVIRRHPDIKLLRKVTDITAYAEKQFALMSALWPLLKQNGLLLYATCSIFPEENENVINHFLKEHSDAHPLPIQASWGHSVSVGHQFLPGQNNMDGFYYARIEKR
jgi:16S rRNA (cytosine967-C5)-methyltransferase